MIPTSLSFSPPLSECGHIQAQCFQVDEAKVRIEKVHTRIQDAKGKVRHLASMTTKATTVLSAAKYPAPAKYAS